MTRVTDDVHQRSFSAMRGDTKVNIGTLTV
jgi:hypothetical protein